MANKLVLDLNSPVTPFEINEGQGGPDLLPNPQGLVFSADEYSSRFTSTIKSGGGMLALFKDMLPPATQSFGKICFSDDTEVLTKTGWKLFRDVSIEHDYFATLNTKTQEFEWQKASHKTYNDYCGLMYHLKSRSTDLIVTPNHRVIHYGTYKNKNLLQISTAEELYNKYGALITSASQPQMPLTSVWKGEKIERFTLEAEKPAVKDKLPANYNPKHVFNCIFCGCEFYRPSRCLGVVPEYCSTDCRHLSDRLPINMSGDDYCAFMGMYLAEGCTANNQDTGKPGYIHITQLTKSKGFTPYKELLTKIFGKEPSYLGKAFVLSNTLLAEYVKQYGRFAQDKLIPEQIMNATLTQIQIFLKYFGFGDGIEVDYATKKGFGTRVKYFTSSKKMADQLQELIQKAGYSAYIGTIAAKVSPMERTKYFADGTVATTTQMINSGVCYNISTRFVDRRHFRIEKFHNYKGKIGCVSVPNGTLYVRRKNIPVWSGNSYMPNNSTSQLGILQWPGLPPESLAKLSKEMIGIHIVVNQRVTDIFRYSQLSEVPWRPGWSIKPLDRKEKETAALRKEIRECEGFLANCGFGPTYANPLTRDQMLRPSFAKFLEEVVRDTLIYDGIAIWTDVNGRGQIRSFAPLPAKNIRLLARPDSAKLTQVHQGELNFYGSTDISDAARGGTPAMDPLNLPFACIIDESNNVVKYFGREELVWYTRNPRIESEIGGYGFPEIEMALVLITGFNNAIQFNADIFDKNSIPKGILAIKGNFTQRQFDALGRLWDNLQRGSRTDWTLPALQLSEKGSIEVINMEALRKEPAYYNNLINLFMGALAAVYCIPVHRLGYKISGTERDSRPDTPKSMQEDDDLGLPALLTHLELIVNQYLIPSRWPLLKFEFTGKSPKEDNRLYEISLLTKTNDERRALVGDPPYASLLPRDASKLDEYIAKTMGLAPVDPAQAGIYQSILAAAVKAGALNEELGIPMPVAGGEGGAGGPGKSGLGDIPGARMKPKKDPHESEKHGHQSGVRRHAKDEKSPKTEPTKGT